MDFDGMKLKGIDSEGNETECEIMHSFDCEETGKSYIVYTDGATDDEGKLRLLASSYTKDGDNLMLDPVVSDEEWQIIEEQIYSNDEQQ
ncbi:MAG: DUF1292 domain-containing protein [Oscillospiraceae bacterium]